MNISQHIAPDDLYLYALQLLPETEMQSAAVHLKDCGTCRATVGDIQGDMVTYAMTAEAVAPPSQARERLLRQVAREKKFVPADRVEPVIEPVLAPRNSRMFQMEPPEQRRSKTPVVLAWVGWAVAAGVAVAAGLEYQQNQQLKQNMSTQTAQLQEKLNATAAESARAQEALQTITGEGATQVALHIPVTPANVNPEGHVAYLQNKGSLVFIASHLDPLQQAKTYELWLLASDGSAVPAGLFKPDASGNASVVMPDLPKGLKAVGFGVTVEEDGGSKTPTKPIVLLGLAE
jgi:anti-sigma-K factor RskA